MAVRKKSTSRAKKTVSKRNKAAKSLMDNSKLSDVHKTFCIEYITHWNATQAYQVAYPKAGYGTARVQSCRLLAKPNIQAHIKEIQGKIHEIAGVSVLNSLLRLKSIAYGSMGDLRIDWDTLKNYDDLTDDQKIAIESVEVSDTKYGRNVKVKMRDTIRAIVEMNKLAGIQPPDKIEAELTQRVFVLKVQ